MTVVTRARSSTHEDLSLIENEADTFGENKVILCKYDIRYSQNVNPRISSHYMTVKKVTLQHFRAMRGTLQQVDYIVPSPPRMACG